MDDPGEAADTVGARLKAAREVQGRTLDDISKQTRIPARHLVQIEEGRLEGLPAAPYSAGFVKSYARAVGLDPTVLSQAFRADLYAVQRQSGRVAYEPYEPADPGRLPPRMLALVALAIAIVLIAGYAIWRSGVLDGNGPAARAQLAAGEDGDVATPNATNVATPVAKPAIPVGGTVVLTAKQPVWIKVSERDGATLFLGVIEPGKSYPVPATAIDPVIRTGRAEAIDVTVGGRPAPPLGPPAKTLSDVSLKPAALMAGGTSSVPKVEKTQVRTIAPPAAPGDVPPAFANSTSPTG